MPTLPFEAGRANASLAPAAPPRARLKTPQHLPVATSSSHVAFSSWHLGGTACQWRVIGSLRSGQSEVESESESESPGVMLL